jgi:hypothetical protein
MREAMKPAALAALVALVLALAAAAASFVLVRGSSTSTQDCIALHKSHTLVCP